MKSIQQTAAWTGSNRYGRKFEQLDLSKQFRVLLDELGLAHLHKNKINGNLNRKHRQQAIFQFARDLRSAGLNLQNLLNLKQKHIAAAVYIWKANGLAASTIQTRLSHLRWLTVAVGKRGFVLRPQDYGLAAEDVARTYVAMEDKSWSAKNVDVKKKIAQAQEKDPFVGAQLEVMHAFGLRVTEAILFRPREADRQTYIDVIYGTKGGRARTVLIRSTEQRAALDRAKAVAARTDRGSLVPRGKKPGQALNRLYYVMKVLGLTKSQLGVTAHGLRHAHANDVYEIVAGEPSVVRGGSRLLDRAVEEAARRAVTQDLGHARLGITASYLGPRRPGRPLSNDQPRPAPGDSDV